MGIALLFACLSLVPTKVSAQRTASSEIAELDAFQGRVLETTKQFPKLERRVIAASDEIPAKIVEVYATDRKYRNLRIERSFSALGEPVERAMVADQLIVETWSACSKTELESLLSDLGATVVEDLVDGRCFLIQLPSQRIDTFDSAMASLKRKPGVFRNVGPNGYGVVLDTAIPDYDPLLANDEIFEDGVMWHLDNPDDHDIDAPEGWSLQNSAPNTIIAVVDTGVDLDHPDLAENLWTDAFGYHGYDFVNDDNYPDDLHVPGLPPSNAGHGSQVAGLVAATGNNNLGVTGVVWDPQIMAIAVLWTPEDPERREAFSSDDIILLGMNYAIDNGAHIVNCSWRDNSSVFDAVLEKARDCEVMVVTSAGNEESDVDSADRPYPQKLLPNYPNMIVVGASDRNDGVFTLENGTTGILE